MPESETPPISDLSPQTTPIAKPPEQKPPIQPEAPVKKREQLPIEFYVTTHAADNRENHNPEQLRALFREFKKQGVKSFRFDFHWDLIEAAPGKFDKEQLGKYIQARAIMKEEGLDEPTIILSNIPGWAKDLYHKDKEKFFNAYRQYVRTVRDALMPQEGRAERVQILNELNNGLYTPIKPKDIPKLCEITRAELANYNPNIKLVATVIGGTLVNAAALIRKGTEVRKFLKQNKDMLISNFDVIAVDNYPAVWHYPLGEVKLRSKNFLNFNEFKKQVFVDMAKGLGLLKEVLTELASWGKEYEIGEVGIPTIQPWGNNQVEQERIQRYFFDLFARELKHLFNDFEKRGVKLPAKIGLYEATDENKKGPEGKFGLTAITGEGKMILQGNLRHPQKGEPSQLQRIIEHIRKPLVYSDAIKWYRWLNRSHPPSPTTEEENKFIEKIKQRYENGPEELRNSFQEILKELAERDKQDQAKTIPPPPEKS